MAWTNPETFTAGQTLTAASMNAISANTEALREGRPDAVSPAVRATANSSTTLLNGNLITIAYAGADAYDTDTMHDPASNNTRITINTAGVYVFTSMLTVTGTPLNYQEIVLTANGSTRIGQLGFGGTLSGKITITSSWLCSVGDYIETKYYHTTGTSLGVNTGTDQTFFSATWIAKGSA